MPQPGATITVIVTVDMAQNDTRDCLSFLQPLTRITPEVSTKGWWQWGPGGIAEGSEAPSAFTRTLGNQ